jgi:hypothetical protein
LVVDKADHRRVIKSALLVGFEHESSASKRACVETPLFVTKQGLLFATAFPRAIHNLNI